MKEWHIRLDHAAQALAVLQRSAIRRLDLAYSQLIDYDMALIRPYLPKEAKRILDIGSGIAAIDVRLHQVYPAAHFYLLDRTGFNVKFGLETEQVFYNSQSVARDLLVSNGVPAAQIHLLEATPSYEIGVDKVDLALSLFSWGWHYPLGAYAEAIKGAMAAGGILVVDVRNWEGQELLEVAFCLKASVGLQDGERCFYTKSGSGQSAA